VEVVFLITEEKVQSQRNSIQKIDLRCEIQEREGNNMKSINERLTKHEELLDIIVVDDSGTIMGRPILKVLIDNCTGMIVESEIDGYKKI
jgi:hypothetical protein